MGNSFIYTRQSGSVYSDIFHKSSSNINGLSSSRVLPQRVVGLQVGLVAAADRHAVVTQKVGRSADALADVQSAAVHLEHAFVQQLVQDGCRTRPIQSINVFSTRRKDTFRWNYNVFLINGEQGRLYSSIVNSDVTPPNRRGQTTPIIVSMRDLCRTMSHFWQKIERNQNIEILRRHKIHPLILR